MNRGTQAMLKSRLFPMISLLTAAVVLLSSCQVISPTAENPQQDIPIVTQAPGVSAEGKLAPQYYVNLSFKAGGKVTEVLVKEGEQVKEGQVIAHLDQQEQFASAVDNASYELLNAQQALKDLQDNAEVNTAQALQKVADGRDAVRSAERYLNNLNTGSKEVDINQTKADVVILKDRLDKAQEDFAPYAKKPEDNVTRAQYLSKLSDAQRKYDNAVRLLNNLEGSASDIDLSVAEANLSLAQASLTLAEQEYDKVKNGPDPDQLASAQAREKAAETGLAAAKAALEDRELKAPISGTLAKLDLKAGELASPGAVVAVLADFSNWIVETDDLTELDVPKVSVGQNVRVTFDALPDVELSGKVDSISEVHEEKSGDVTYTTKVSLTESDPRLRWGMTAVAHFVE
jgi:multidrug efflux pump subunit AcrA (membrane-fusion protein)